MMFVEESRGGMEAMDRHDVDVVPRHETDETELRLGELQALPEGDVEHGLEPPLGRQLDGEVVQRIQSMPTRAPGDGRHTTEGTGHGHAASGKATWNVKRET